MKTEIQVLSRDECSQIHERSLKILENTGVRVETALGRNFLNEAGARVDAHSNIVRFSRSLVEEALRNAPKTFSLGARRPECSIPMNTGDCYLIPDGEALYVVGRKAETHRIPNFDDWLQATRLVDALDEIGVYWAPVQGGKGDDSIGDTVRFFVTLFKNFSKHVQEALPHRDYAPWLLEVLQVIFGDQRSIRIHHPISYLLCPQSPLIIDQQYTDAYLALLGWDIPVAVMPMPLMGGTAPGSLFSTAILGNCEVLAMICLLQSAAPGTPVIYAPALATMNPRTGAFSGGAIENGLLGAAVTQMGRYYGLPVEASGGGSNPYIPGIQAEFERSLISALSTLAWPDLLVGAGLVGNSTVLSFEQMFIDTEIFRMIKHAHTGITMSQETTLDDIIEQVGPAGDFLGERTTVQAIRRGEWHLSELGVHEPLKTWKDRGSGTLFDEARDRVEELLATHHPLPLPGEAERELIKIHKRAVEASQAQ